MLYLAFVLLVHWIGASDEWLASKAAGYGEVYMNTIAGYFKIWWVFPVMIILCFLGGAFFLL